MLSLKSQLYPLIGSGVILWLNHPELKTINGQLTDVQPHHLALVDDQGHSYVVPYNGIVALRPASSDTD
jgi:hypothetical protein